MVQRAHGGRLGLAAVVAISAAVAVSAAASASAASSSSSSSTSSPPSTAVMPATDVAASAVPASTPARQPVTSALVAQGVVAVDATPLRWTASVVQLAAGQPVGIDVDPSSGLVFVAATAGTVLAGPPERPTRRLTATEASAFDAATSAWSPAEASAAVIGFTAAADGAGAIGDPLPLGAGRYDVHLLHVTLPPGGATAVAGAGLAPTLVLADGITVVSAGVTTPVVAATPTLATGTFELHNDGTTPATVWIADVVAAVEAPAADAATSVPATEPAAVVTAATPTTAAPADSVAPPSTAAAPIDTTSTTIATSTSVATTPTG